VFTYAWRVYGALQPAPLDEVVMERSLRQARKVSARGYCDIAIQRWKRR
jgi:hypothetical protein